MNLLDFTLPEIVFLEPSEHLENEMGGRTVIQHTGSHTIMEVIATDEVEGLDFKAETKTYEFEYLNLYGVVENHIFAVHFTLNEGDLTEVFKQCAEWYRAYLSWEDRNILEDEE